MNRESLTFLCDHRCNVSFINLYVGKSLFWFISTVKSSLIYRKWKVNLCEFTKNHLFETFNNMDNHFERNLFSSFLIASGVLYIYFLLFTLNMFHFMMMGIKILSQSFRLSSSQWNIERGKAWLQIIFWTLISVQLISLNFFHFLIHFKYGVFCGTFLQIICIFACKYWTAYRSTDFLPT